MMDKITFLAGSPLESTGLHWSPLESVESSGVHYKYVGQGKLLREMYTKIHFIYLVGLKITANRQPHLPY